jgi:hypothetical protein
MSKSAELASLASEIEQVLERVCDAVQGLNEAQLNWRPPVPDANSTYATATHVLGSAEGWVIGVACDQPIERDRSAEFRTAGPDAAAIVARARSLAPRLDRAISALEPGDMDKVRVPAASLWSGGSAEPLTTREALLHVIAHSNEHLGHIAVTRDWMRATQA